VDAYTAVGTETFGNAARAAVAAGYSPRSARQQAVRLLTNASIRQAIAERQHQREEAADLSATRVLEELRRLATSDLTGLFDDAGHVKRFQDLVPEQRANHRNDRSTLRVHEREHRRRFVELYMADDGNAAGAYRATPPNCRSANAVMTKRDRQELWAQFAADDTVPMMVRRQAAKCLVRSGGGALLPENCQHLLVACCFANEKALEYLWLHQTRR
jgi:hypothetical protein